MASWEIQGRELINCNCSYGCPCQFNALPTHGNCEAVGCFSIEHGHHGEINLDGLAFAMAVAWPGAIHQGKGRCQPYVDSRADEQQREALLTIGAAETEREAKANVNTAIDRVAERLNNTRAVCRKYYIHPAILDAYVDGRLAAAFGRLKSPDSTRLESRVVKLLQKRAA